MYLGYEISVCCSASCLSWLCGFGSFSSTTDEGMTEHGIISWENKEEEEVEDEEDEDDDDDDDDDDVEDCDGSCGS